MSSEGKTHYEKYKERYTLYRNEHKEERKLHRKNYYQLNKERELDKCKAWKEKNWNRLHEIITCECGGHYKFMCKARHIKSMRHQRYSNIKQPEETLTVGEAHCTTGAVGEAHRARGAVILVSF